MNNDANPLQHRIARLEAQSDIRGRAVVIYRDRAREAEARLKAVRALATQEDDHGDWVVTRDAVLRALNGDA